MNSTLKSAQLQYQGFLNTDFLWLGVLNGIQKFELNDTKSTSFNLINKPKLRLGKWVERLVSFQLQQDDSIKILAENLQIQHNNITVGEIDCILLQNNSPIHLEIVYKFYLYDSSVGNTEIEHWIGPNRRDSFIEKLNKLKNKQLPLLYSKHTKPYLDNLKLDITQIQQKVYFKAQLFVPLKDYENSFPLINNNCIQGFYIYPNELNNFKSAKFYIPNKQDWLVEPHTHINWILFDSFKIKLEEYLAEQNAPLCWMKKKNGELIKFFVVWW